MRSLISFLAGVFLSIGGSAAAEVGAELHLVIPGTTYEVVGRKSQLDRSGRPKIDLMRAIGAWISVEFDLPGSMRLPQVVLSSEDQMISLRYQASDPDKPVDPAVRNARPEVGHEIVALYDDRARTIYLSKDWSGRTSAEISVLVHETVHHLQNLAGLKFACAGEREKTAYRAQARFLSLFEQSLETEFGIDPMTLLVRTNCVM
jgi:hypothetical protein